MKRILLAGVCAGAALVAIPRSATAQWSVLCTNCTSEFSEVIREGRRAAEVVKQLAEAKRQYDQLVSITNQIAGVRDLGGAVNALGMLGIQNPLPADPNAVQGLLSGRGGVQGMSGNLSNLFGSQLNQNRVYQTPGNTWAEQEINANGAGIAGAQAVALQIYQTAAQRMPLLDNLRSQISAATDQGTRDSLTAQFAAENGIMQNLGLQAQAVNNYMQGQIALQPQRVMERRQQEIADVIADARARGIVQ